MGDRRTQLEEGSRILITGATGYIGNKLMNALAHIGYRLRAFARHPEEISLDTDEAIEVAQGDMLRPETIDKAMEGVHTAFYLIHSMGEGGDFVELDRKSATNFADAARKAGVKRIIYLGGLGTRQGMSAHLESRHEVGDILRESGAQVFEFRASIVIGAGSISFELIRDLVERVPFFISSRWTKTECQPIYVGDVIKYLSTAIEKDIEGNKIYEIGASDTSCYLCLLLAYARLRRIKRVAPDIPLFTPGLASVSLRIITPRLFPVGRWLLHGMNNPTIVTDNIALADFPDIKPIGTVRAIRVALVEEDREFGNLRWSEALAGKTDQPWGGFRMASRYVYTHVIHADCPADLAFDLIKKIGGETGWYKGNSLWKIRGLMDILVGGPGLRIEHPHTEDLKHGDIIDFFHVDFYHPDGWLRLEAEMKVPGKAWLDFEVDPEPDGCRIRVTAIFYPRGVFGLNYWYFFYPFHGYIFRGMLQEIARKGERMVKGHILLQALHEKHEIPDNKPASHAGVHE